MKFRAQQVNRDEDGGYCHPQLPDFGGNEYISDVAIKNWQDEMNFNLVINRMDLEVNETHPAYIHYFEDHNPGFSEWNPESPNGDAILLSIHDTEDGPVAWWAVCK